MNDADEVGVPALKEVRDHVEPFAEQLTAFVGDCRSVEPETPLDVVGLGFVLKGAVRFHDILVMVKHHRFIGAEALLRGLWESRVLFKYLMAYDGEPQTVAHAYGDYMDYDFAQKGRKVASHPITQQPEILAKFDDYERKFAAHSPGLQAYCKTTSNTKAVCEALDLKTAATLPDGTPISFVGEYNMVFRVFSNAVHGSLSDGQRYFETLDAGGTPTDEQVDELSRVLMLIAYNWMRDLLRTWSESTDDSPYLRLFHRHFPDADDVPSAT